MSVFFRAGVDIVEVARVERLVGDERARRRVFADEEVAFCSAAGEPGEEYARLWAVKEAVLKALGTGWSAGVAWTDVRVARSGRRYSVCLGGKAAEVAAGMGIADWSVDADSGGGMAVAFALGRACGGKEET